MENKFSVYDSHCHVRAVPDADHSGDETCEVVGGLVCGTHPEVDWDLVERVADLQLDNLHVGFGVHPWYTPASSAGSATPDVEVDGSGSVCCAVSSIELASTTVADLLSVLEKQLLRFPRSWVAEIGLDKMKGSQALQIELCQQQLLLAGRLRRPVSLHCVRSFGPLLTLLSSIPAHLFPPVIVLHGFTGSPEFAKSLLKLPKGKSNAIFFGIGLATTGTLKGYADLIKSLPPNRILYESDLHHSFVAGNLAWRKSNSSDHAAFLATLTLDARIDNFAALLKRF